jgi:hypothetical protein
MIYSFDPGLTTGYAIFENNGKALELGDIKIGDLFKFLENMDNPDEVGTVVVEDYRIFQNKANAHILKKLTPPKIIGALEYWAYLRGYEFILQTPSTKEMGYRYADMAKAKEHSFSHSLDAYAHGVFFCVNRKIALADSFRKPKSKDILPTKTEGVG